VTLNFSLVRRSGIGACLLGILILLLRYSAIAADPVIPVLDTGTQIYSNVTISSKSATHVFIKHSKGISGLKVSELNQESLVKLGYEEAPKAKAAEAKPEPTEAGPSRAEKISDKINYKQLFGDHQQPKVTVDPDGAIRIEQDGRTVVLDKRVLMIGAGVLLFLYIFWSGCSMAICRKSGVTGFFSGLLCWLGGLRAIPLLRAAGMSPWWFLLLLVPGVNVLAMVILFVVWCIKITNVREKGGFTAMFLLFVPTFPLAFLYLAFSGSGSGGNDEVAPMPQKIQLRYET
jgi:hypothetical protein